MKQPFDKILKHEEIPDGIFPACGRQTSDLNEK
jgi:hypothetical protein